MRQNSFVLAISAVLTIVSLRLVLAQDAKLIEAAKKEGGKVVVYGSIENDTMDLVAAAFKKKTGLEVDYWRAASNKVTDRVTGESRAGFSIIYFGTLLVMHAGEDCGLRVNCWSPLWEPLC